MFGKMINDLIAKSAIEKKLLEIINPVISDMGFELVRLRLMSNKEITLQIMATRPNGYINVDECAEILNENEDNIHLYSFYTGLDNYYASFLDKKNSIFSMIALNPGKDSALISGSCIIND